jgi:hypothetical protein
MEEKELKLNEKMSSYFDDKVYLQSFVFDKSTTDRERIEDLLDGLPKYMVPILKGSIRVNTDLLEFRRILLDYEDGLRPSGLWNGKAKLSTSDFIPSHTQMNPVRNTPAPPRPCSCGEMHWYKDCPKRSSRANVARPFPSLPNCIAITNSKWPRSTSGHSERQIAIASPSSAAEAHINLADIDIGEDPTARPECLPEQDNDGYAELYETLCNNTIAYTDEISSPTTSPEHVRPLPPSIRQNESDDNAKNYVVPASTDVVCHVHNNLDTPKAVIVPDAERNFCSDEISDAVTATRDEKDTSDKDFRNHNEVFGDDQNPILVCEAKWSWEIADVSVPCTYAGDLSDS